MEDQNYVWGVWQDAFCKFGYKDGDGFIRSYDVAKCLEQAGYDVTIGNRGIHNTVINSIKLDGLELLPLHAPNIRYGYDHPQLYLPSGLIYLLDTVFSHQNTVLHDKISQQQELD